MNIKAKQSNTTYRVQLSGRVNVGTLREVTMPSGAKVITMKSKTFQAAKEAASRALADKKAHA